MRRRAAGRADGRHRLGLAVTAGLLTVLPLVVPATATAAPTSAPTGSAARESGTNGTGSSDDDRPVRITVSRLEPRTVTPGATIVLSGTLVNDSEDSFTDLAVRLQRGGQLKTRQALADDLAAPDDASDASGPFTSLPDDLEPGGTVSFTYTTTAEELELATAGVYPALVNVNGTREGGDAERIGELSTYLVAQPEVPLARTSVAWLWPIADRTHRSPTGAFLDDDLADELAEDGRLDRALAVLEQVSDGPAAVPVTLAVDPALLEEIAAMAAGRYTVGGEPGEGSEAAAEFLGRLRRVAADHPVVALPYGDVDVDALVGSGQDAVVTRSLPGTPAGTAQQPVPGSGTATALPSGSAGAGAAVIGEVLDVTPRTDLAWPAGGTVRAETLDVLAEGGMSTVVLSQEALVDGDRAVGDVRGVPASVPTTLTTAAGPVTVLVADDALGQAVADAAAGTTSARLAEQRYLAELGVLTTMHAAAAPAPAQTVLVVPPRDVGADPGWASQMIGDTVSQPWLGANALADLAVAPDDGTDRLAAAAAPEDRLSSDGLERIARAAAFREDFAAAVPGDRATVLSVVDAAISRAGSAAWRDDPSGFAAATENLQETVAELRAKVTLLAPADGTYSLASSDAPLVLTVQNDFPFAVDVRLSLRTRGNVGLTTDDVGVTTLQPKSRTPVQVPAHVRQSGSFSVDAMLRTPTGEQLGNTVQMQVKSTAYGTVTVVITLGAAALLGLLFLRRLVNYLLRRHRGTPPVDEPAADPTTAPPVRSPV